jgi:hypothetical protein
MRRTRWLPLFLLILVLASLAPAALAQAEVPAPAPGAPQAGGVPPAADPESALGALASIGCGFFVRASIATAGTQVGTIVGAVACCGYMLFDAFAMD